MHVRLYAQQITKSFNVALWKIAEIIANKYVAEHHSNDNIVLKKLSNNYPYDIKQGVMDRNAYTVTIRTNIPDIWFSIVINKDFALQYVKAVDINNIDYNTDL